MPVSFISDDQALRYGRFTKTATGADLSILPLDKIDEPLSLTDLHKAIDARLPQLDLPELILEMHTRTGFGAAFTHASEGNARAEDIATTICAVLVAEATNTGFEPLLRPEVPALRRSRLSWVKQNFMRAETLTSASWSAGTPNSARRSSSVNRSRRLIGNALNSSREGAGRSWTGACKET